MNEDLIYEILSVVEEIPAGCVATYGQIARLIGREKNAGRLVPGWPEQGQLLQAEGVALKDLCHVDIKLYQWDC